MKLYEWRRAQGKTLSEVAALVGIGGNNPARVYQRWETGERGPTAIQIEAICVATRGEVTPSDMHETRLAWEQANPVGRRVKLNA